MEQTQEQKIADRKAELAKDGKKPEAKKTEAPKEADK